MYMFRSGGGLRVVRIEQEKKRGKLLGYGEYCNVEPAIEIADLDLVKKKSKKYTVEYLTGSCDNTSKLDQWVRSGLDTNFNYEDGKFVFRARMEYMTISPPKYLIDLVTFSGISREWSFKGRKYLISPIKFANNDPGCSIKCLNHSDYKDAWRYPIDHLLSADTFEGLFELLEEKLGDMDNFEKMVLNK